jgi:hypothetical protein
MAPMLTAASSTRMPVGQLRYARADQIMMGTMSQPMMTKNHGWPKATPAMRQAVSAAAGASRYRASSARFRALCASV